MIRSSKKTAIHFLLPPLDVNSYVQTGQTLLLASISMAQEGHSFFFTVQNVKKFPRESSLFHRIHHYQRLFLPENQIPGMV